MDTTSHQTAVAAAVSGPAIAPLAQQETPHVDEDAAAAAVPAAESTTEAQGVDHQHTGEHCGLVLFREERRILLSGNVESGAADRVPVLIAHLAQMLLSGSSRDGAAEYALELDPGLAAEVIQPTSMAFASR